MTLARAEPLTQPTDHAGRLVRLERRLWVLFAAPFVVCLPATFVLAALSVHRDRPDDHPVLLAGMVLLLTAMIVTYPGMSIVNGLGALAYRYRHSYLGRPVDWSAPRWAPVAATLRAHGIEPTAVTAHAGYFPTDNLYVRHVPRPLPGRWQRLSDWAVVHRRLLMAGGVALGVGTDVLDSRWPRWKDWTDSPAFGVAVAVLLAVLLPGSASIARRMYRRNIRDADLVVQIPMAWRARLGTHPMPSLLLFAHEWSHVRHRDVLRRRLHSAYGAWLTLVVVCTQAAAVSTLAQAADALVPVGLLLTAVSAVVMRRVRRAIPLVQEARADADACTGPHAGATGTYAAALRDLPAVDSRQRRHRLRALTDTGHRRLVRRTDALLVAGWTGYVGVTVLADVVAAASGLPVGG